MHWLLKITFTLIYTVVYFFLALLNTGGGHGNYYLLTPAFPWLLLFPVIYFIGKLDTQLNRILFVLFMITHYVLVFVFLLNYSFEEDRGWKYGVPLIPIIWYLAGQIAIWVLFINERMMTKKV